MPFPTPVFFIFFLIVFAGSWLLRPWRAPWKLFLLGASYVFYASWDPRFLLVLLNATLGAWGAGAAIARLNGRPKKLILALAVIGNVGMLAGLKYYDFFRESLASLLHTLGLPGAMPTLLILLPVGLSFYLLRATAYVVDIYRGKTTAASPVDCALYIAFFPQLLSGPITRPETFITQLKSKATVENPHEHIGRIVQGLFKKIVLSSFLTIQATDPVFGLPDKYGAASIAFAVLAYTLVIYLDFSGYSDMAIGTAGLLGFSSPENFNLPYAACSLQEFWRRWHISFSDWLRDYVYIPLGGNRKGRFRKHLNALATMLISGLWHGVGGTYMLWGLLHGVGLAVGVGAKKTAGAAGSALGWCITILFVSVTWIFFRAESVAAGLGLLRGLAEFRPGEEIITPLLFFVAACGIAYCAFENHLLRLFVKTQERLPLALQGAVIAALVIAIVEAGPDIVPPFIYFQF